MAIPYLRTGRRRSLRWGERPRCEAAGPKRCGRASHRPGPVLRETRLLWAAETNVALARNVGTRRRTAETEYAATRGSAAALAARSARRSGERRRARWRIRQRTISFVLRP